MVGDICWPKPVIGEIGNDQSSPAAVGEYINLVNCDAEAECCVCAPRQRSSGASMIQAPANQYRESKIQERVSVAKAGSGGGRSSRRKAQVGAVNSASGGERRIWQDIRMFVYVVGYVEGYGQVMQVDKRGAGVGRTIGWWFLRYCQNELKSSGYISFARSTKRPIIGGSATLSCVILVGATTRPS